MPVAREVPFPQTAPAIVVGKILYINKKTGEEHGCTGASIASDSGNTVWTAGHCVHPGDGSGADGFHEKITFIPGFKQFFCTGNAEDAFDLNPLDDRVKVDCDMGKGASGGPIATTEAQIISANSHYETEDDGVTRKNDDVFGSEHGDQAVAVINEINQ